MTDRWTKYANQHMAQGVARAAYGTWHSQSTSLGYLLAARPPPARFLSIGCSAGYFDVLVAAHGYEVTSVDNDPEVLTLAERLARDFEVKLTLHEADAFDLSAFHGRFDIAFSAGLVEHWHGARTVELIREHARCAPVVQVEVPTVHTRRLEAVPEVLADAHLHTARELRGRVRAAGLRPVRLYPVGGVPTRTREVIENLLPPLLFRRLQLLTSYAMGIGCIGVRRDVN